MQTVAQWTCKVGNHPTDKPPTYIPHYGYVCAEHVAVYEPELE